MLDWALVCNEIIHEAHVLGADIEAWAVIKDPPKADQYRQGALERIIALQNQLTGLQVFLNGKKP